eukprot:6793557-Prymnesium_polylepis.2
MSSGEQHAEHLSAQREIAADSASGPGLGRVADRSWTARHSVPRGAACCPHTASPLAWCLSLHPRILFACTGGRSPASENRVCRDAGRDDHDAGLLLIEAPAGVDWSLQSLKDVTSRLAVDEHTCGTRVLSTPYVRPVVSGVVHVFLSYVLRGEA